tara:strand:+ start:1066 stop:1848 length:783 start_codon:yes stop_codon:yes gene_type:complete
MSHIKDLQHKNSYKKLEILKQTVNFFAPNKVVEWRIDTFYSKEPETLDWINSFENNEKTIFWDIGANIGLYSIYNAIKNNKSTTYAFEPSTSNLRVLSRNISINNLEQKIKIFTNPLTDKSNEFRLMQENDFYEGGALNTFGENFNFEGKKKNFKMKYSLMGVSINHILNNQILSVPTHIKIDVDGIEHLILEGANKFLKDEKLKTISVEINENFKDQHDKIFKIMKNNNFRLLHKKHNNQMFPKGSIYENTFNFIFVRN